MGLFPPVAFAMMLVSATARYAYWFECTHPMSFVAAMSAVVVITMAVAIGNCVSAVGIVLIVGIMMTLAADAAEHRDGLRAKAPLATLAAMLLLLPHVDTWLIPIYGGGIGTIVLAGLAWTKTWR